MVKAPLVRYGSEENPLPLLGKTPVLPGSFEVMGSFNSRHGMNVTWLSSELEMTLCLGIAEYLDQHSAPPRSCSAPGGAEQKHSQNTLGNPVAITEVVADQSP